VHWQQQGLGRAVLAAEAQLLALALDDVFGFELLQLGAWGPDRELIGISRTRMQRVVGAQLPGAAAPDIVANLAMLPVASTSVDAVLLPHCLETEPNPHAVLREADRVLVGEGHLLVLGFQPLSLWGLRAAASRTGFPPGARRMLGAGRVREWLELLGYEVGAARRYLYLWPGDAGSVVPEAGPAATPGLLRRGLLNPFPAGAYLLKARKRVYTPTPIRPRRREAATVLGSLANPSS
jgi:SAM-dependent methyltransferase